METLEEVTGRPTTSEDRERILSLAKGCAGCRFSTCRAWSKRLTDPEGGAPADSLHQGRSGRTARQGRAERRPGLFPPRGDHGGEAPRRLSQAGREPTGSTATSSWMVGNSPRSDINPALEVGLGAVYIPHPEHLEPRARRGPTRERRPAESPQEVLRAPGPLPSRIVSAVTKCSAGEAGVLELQFSC